MRSVAKYMFFLAAVSNSALAARITTIELQTEDHKTWKLTQHCIGASGKECWSAVATPWLIKFMSNVMCGMSGGNRHAVKNGGCETEGYSCSMETAGIRSHATKFGVGFYKKPGPDGKCNEEVASDTTATTTTTASRPIGSDVADSNTQDNEETKDPSAPTPSVKLDGDDESGKTLDDDETPTPATAPSAPTPSAPTPSAKLNGDDGSGKTLDDDETPTPATAPSAPTPSERLTRDDESGKTLDDDETEETWDGVDKPKPFSPSGGGETDDETWDGVDKPKPSGGDDDETWDGMDKPKPDGRLDCTNLEAQLVQWLSTFTDDCGVLETDVNIIEGQVLDTTRICSEQCRGQSLFQKEPPTLPESLEHCELELEAKLVNLMYGSFQKCGDTPSNPVSNSSVDVMSTNKNCPSQALAHHDCGYMGISQHQCEEKGCCWNPNVKSEPFTFPFCHQSKHSDSGKWCYEEGKQTRETCPRKFDRYKRTDCQAFLMLDQALKSHRDDDFRGKKCRDVGCCWQPLEYDSKEPWCFHKVCA
eukprot:TRINITY_DN1500_c0_g1_i5.p1 TRINITY_DN1500_c0_g1~~TRINITY_DN1500_c0_g1_i5.p1  ORF type:complete len:533 (+),score=99.69 TRINITY_DN1500_c0_g1_i5:85-1683(+)